MSVSKSSSSTKTSDCANSAVDDLDIFSNPSVISTDIPAHRPQTSITKNSKKMKENKKTCCVCAGPGFLSPCLIPMCKNNFHSTCISSYFPELDSKATCPVHSFKQLETYKKRLHMAHHFNSSTSIQKLVKDDKDSNIQPDLKGKLFWYIINQQYFPYFAGHKPELLPPRPDLPQQLTSDFWVDSKILKLQEKLSAVSTSLSSTLLFTETQSQFSSSLEKPGLSLVESGNLQLELQEQLRVNSEALLSVPDKIELKDYHSWQADDKIICAVCDDGESMYENLIVICGSCNLAVHCGCYNIQNIPEQDWFCDVCQASAFGANCVLCPVRGGAMKLAKPNKWVHVTCARYLLSSNLFTFTWDTRNIDRDKLRLTCVACGKKYGACAQCNYGRCAYAFHVECRKDLIEVDQDSAYCLCPQHIIKKLWRNVKTERELAQKFIDKVAEAFWKETLAQAKYEKSVKLEKKERMKRKVVMHITPEAICMKFVFGSKVVKELKYLNEMGSEPRKRKRDEECYFEILDNSCDKVQNEAEGRELVEDMREIEKDQVVGIEQGQVVNEEVEVQESVKVDVVMNEVKTEHEGKGEIAKEEVVKEETKAPFLIFKSQKEKTNSKLPKDEMKPKRKYKKRVNKDNDAIMIDRKKTGKEGFIHDENLVNGFENIEKNEILAGLELKKDPDCMNIDKVDDDIIDQFFYQEKEENHQNFSESMISQANLTIEKKKRVKKEKTEKKEKKEKIEKKEKKEKKEKTEKKDKKERKEKKIKEKKEKIAKSGNDGKPPTEKVRRPRKPKRVITAFPSEKGELWVKLIVPIEIYQRACRKKQKV